MLFKERLQYLRLEKKLSEIQLSQKLGISESVIRLYEKGKLRIDLDHLHKLADYFEVTPGLLLGTAFPHLPPEEALESYRLVNELIEIRQEERKTEPAITPQDAPDLQDTTEKERQDISWHSALRAGVVAVYNKIISADNEANQTFIEQYWPVKDTIMQLYGHDLANYFYFRVHGDLMEPTIGNQSIVLVKRQMQVQNNDLVVVLCRQNPAIVQRISHYEDKYILLCDNNAYPAQLYGQDNCFVLGKILWKIK